MKKNFPNRDEVTGRFIKRIPKLKIIVIAILLAIVGIGCTYSFVVARNLNETIVETPEPIPMTLVATGTQTVVGNIIFWDGVDTSNAKVYREAETDTLWKWMDWSLEDIKEQVEQLRTENEKLKGRTVTVSAYNSVPEQTDSSPCISADGSNICNRYAKGERICATNDWKLGTRLKIKGLGDCVVADRMNRRYTGTGRIDWYMGMDVQGARQFGLKHLNVLADSNGV